MNNKTFKKGLITMAAALALSACGGEASSEDESTQGSAASGEAVTIEYWHGNADTQGGRQVEELVNKFNDSQDEVIVEPVYNDGLYVGLMENLQTSAAGGEYPAVVQIGWAYREYFQSNFEFTDPETLLSTVGEEGNDTYLEDKFPEPMLNLARDFAGNLLGFPYSVSTPVIYVNKELVDEAGVDPTTIISYEELYEMAGQITEATGKHGLYITESNDNWSTQGLIEANGAVTVSEDGQAEFASEEGQKALQDWADSIDAGHTLHTSTDQGHQSFISGDVGMVWTTIAQRTNITENANFESYAIELPPYEGNDPAVPAGGALLAITAREEAEQAAALKFIEFLYEPDNVAIWTSGTGYLPPTNDATENEDLAELIETDQMFQTSYNQMENLVPFASFPGSRGLEASDMYRNMRDRVFGGTPASEAMPETQDEINELLGN